MCVHLAAPARWNHTTVTVALKRGMRAGRPVKNRVYTMPSVIPLYAAMAKRDCGAVGGHA